MSKSRDIADSAATINFIDGLTSAAQTQINSKAPIASPVFTGAVTASSFVGDGSTLTGVGSEIQTVTRTSNTILDSNNNSNLIDITSGTFTQTFTSAATLGNGWFCYIRNSGTGDITLDPAGSETIDGLASFKMYPQEMRLIQSDGTNLTSTVLKSFYKTFTASGTFAKPPGYTSFGGMLWGGGGAGAIRNYGSASGGGGGACNIFNVISSTISSSCSVVIGAGGAAQTTASNIAASSGGFSSFDGALYAYGGGGGISNSYSYPQVSGGGGGGIFSSGEAGSTSLFSFGGKPNPSINTTQGLDNSGFGGASSSTNFNGYAFAGGGSGGGNSSTVGGGESVYGGGGGASSGYPYGGVSRFGGYGGSTGDGVIPAGGGAGTSSSPSGAGARGELRIWGIV